MLLLFVNVSIFLLSLSNYLKHVARMYQSLVLLWLVFVLYLREDPHLILRDSRAYLKHMSGTSDDQHLDHPTLEC